MYTCYRPGGGVWHTPHPNTPEASVIDTEAMKLDLTSAINADTPEIPPLNIIASLTNREPTITAYVPTFELDIDREKVPYLLNSSPIKFSLPPWMRRENEKKFIYHALLFKAEEKLDELAGKSYYEIQEFFNIKQI